MNLLHLYRAPGVSPASRNALLANVRANILPGITAIETEYCFNVQVVEALKPEELRVLQWLLGETFEPDQLRPESILGRDGEVLEVGPRMNFTTAWSTNAVSICRACGLTGIRRIERSRRYLLETPRQLSNDQISAFLGVVHDRMTECRYPKPLDSFETGIEPEPTFEIPLMEEGRAALERINRELGLAFDEWDLDYYTLLFRERVGRNPTNVECFDIAQSNSEHSRHWFFKGYRVQGQLQCDSGLPNRIDRAAPSGQAISVCPGRSRLRRHLHCGDAQFPIWGRSISGSGNGNRRTYP
jgi:phosphoribosylformylglycinamidine synthase